MPPALCRQFVRKIQEALQREAFYFLEVNEILDAPTRMALGKYQRAKGLPFGNLNIETLRELGVI